MNISNPEIVLTLLLGKYFYVPEDLVEVLGCWQEKKLVYRVVMELLLGVKEAC